MSVSCKPVRRWTLEHRNTDTLSADAGDSIEWRKEISAAEYLQFYTRVGEPWNWVDRCIMPQQELTALLTEPNRSVGILKNGDAQDVGFTEICRHSERDIEIAYFGLFPECTGQGLGRLLLSEVVRTARRRVSAAGRVWLTTCEWDSPAALPFYQRMGFAIVAQDLKQQKVAEKAEG